MCLTCRHPRCFSICAGRGSGFDCPQLIFILLAALHRGQTNIILPLDLADHAGGLSDPLLTITYPSGPCLTQNLQTEAWRPGDHERHEAQKHHDIS